MINGIIGRKKEQKILQSAFDSNKAEFIAIYGRRRIGKTYLVKSFFEKKGCTFLYVSGMKDGTLKQQLKNFAHAIESVLIPGYATPSSWMDAFNKFTILTEKIPSKKKIVIFLDELPWLVTKRSKFLQALDYYWNRYWSHDKRIKLIICGSAASWIINNIVRNKGGLYNRLTYQMRLDPFSLKEAKEFLMAGHIRLNNHQIIEIYMVTGGVPYYLTQIQKGLSAAQNIEELAFTKHGVLYQDFDILFDSLFDEGEVYSNIVKTISKYRYGIQQEELFSQCKEISKGGSGVQKLRDLEEAGFIISYVPYQHKRKGKYYRLIDEYANFYLKWIAPSKTSLQKLNKISWMQLRETPSWKSWSGYAFETICLKHIDQIRKSLNIDTHSSVATWRHMGQKDEKGAQIDLLFDRADNAITICEIKYTDNKFNIDKECFYKLKNKIEVYKNITKTKKQIFLVFITSFGLKHNIYSEEYVSNVLTLDDLFS
ncbi:MAG: ATP-binding protein [Chlamydiales bacterium]